MCLVTIIALYLTWKKGVKPLTDHAKIEPADKNMPVSGDRS